MISLGQASNYSAKHVIRHIFGVGTAQDSLKLRRALAKRYGTKMEGVALYHSGRSALAVALKSAVKTDEVDGVPVIIPGLTCIAVVRAVRAASMQPVFVDVTRDNLQYDFSKLEATMKELSAKHSSGVIVIQNTLGITVDIVKIERLAKKYDFVIVEDLAHSAGRRYKDGREVGTVGAAAALSFGKGKAIDTITGGAVVLKGAVVPRMPTKRPRLAERLRDRWYPLLGSICRGLWGAGLGQPLMAFLVRAHFVERSADTRLDINVRLTHPQAKLALMQLNQLDDARFSPDGKANNDVRFGYLDQSPARDYRLVRNRTKLLAELLDARYNFSEIWYDTPVSPARYAGEADFPEENCPETVKLAREIINIPTWYPKKRLKRAYEIIKKYEL